MVSPAIPSAIPPAATKDLIKGIAPDAVSTPVPDAVSTPEMSSTAPAPGGLIVLAGPSGVGKGTLLTRLLQTHPEMTVSVSATTRQPRTGEVEGEHYFFRTRAQFEAMVQAGDLLEWAEFAGNCYGTPKAPIESAIAKGRQVILEIELLGARQVRESFPEAKQIFILPPDVETLEARIRSRGQDSEAAIEKRLKQAKVELAAADEFDLKIVNDNLEAALAKLTAAILD